MARTVIDLTTFPSGKRYEDQYGKLLEVFKTVAESPEEVMVVAAPRSWGSLIYYLGGECITTTRYSEDTLLPHDNMSGYVHQAEKNGMLRELVEVHSALRPELVDALYKSDMEWKTVNRRHQWKKSFNVTCNGSFFRPEVLDYINNILPTHNPTKTKCVLCPCAADKPYPSPMHEAILKVLPEDYELIVVTGVLGLVPQALWDRMPVYDAGLPSQWRITTMVADYFHKHPRYTKVVVYSEFNAESIYRGFASMRAESCPYDIRYIFGQSNIEYLDLMSDENIAKLIAAVGGSR
jgi:predicted RNA-binding protein